MNWPTVSIIVLNYNGKHHLEECFASLLALDYAQSQLQLMLVDNASSDGSVEFVRAQYPGVVIVQNTENLGFAGGNNRGAEAATSDYVVFLNNDMRVHPDFATGLIKAIQSTPGAVSAGAKILNWDETQFDFAGAIGDFAGHAYQTDWGAAYTPDKHTKVQPILFACGGAMLVDRRIFLESGGFDENYFIYYEDIDLGWRLWLLGHKVVFAPDALTTHKHHGTMSGFADYRKWVLFKRNSIYTVLKNYSDANLGKVLPTILLATVDGIVDQSVGNGHLDLNDFAIRNRQPSSGPTVALDKQQVGSLIALHDIVEHLPSAMEKRHFVQANRKRSDEELAHLFQWPFRYWPDVKLRTQLQVADLFGLQALYTGIPRKVLVVSSDILPYPGMPTVGSGLRAWGLGQGLKSRGHTVVFAMPQAALKGREKSAPPEAIENAWEPETLHQVVRRVEPDLVVVCNWPVLDNMQTDGLDVPIVLDQHGPHYLEREYNQFGAADDNARRKLNALRKADFFTCAGEKQLAYFHSWLERAGWSERERQERAAAIPVSLSPDLPERKAADELAFVYGGVFLPWQNPSVALLALVEEMKQRRTGKLYFYGGKHPVYDVETGIFDKLLSQLQTSPHVIAPGMVSHDELIERYTQSHVAVDVMARNPERELAFTTRTVEYLWCGLPVLYHDYAELSDYIREYEAGWIVSPDDAAGLQAALEQIFTDPVEVARRSANAQRLVAERLTWDRTIAPLDGFVRYPRVRSRAIAQPPTVRAVSVTPLLPRSRGDYRHLLSELRRHYRRGGLKILVSESLAFAKRQLGMGR